MIIINSNFIILYCALYYYYFGLDMQYDYEAVSIMIVEVTLHSLSSPRCYSSSQIKVINGKYFEHRFFIRLKTLNILIRTKVLSVKVMSVIIVTDKVIDFIVSSCNENFLHRVPKI